jgi:hypothetical protein
MKATNHFAHSFKTVAMLFSGTALTLSLSVPARADRYYTREEVTNCQDQDVSTAAGAILGGVVGAGIGAGAGVLAGGSNSPAIGAAVGGAVGLGAGGILGFGLSCDEESRTIRRFDTYLNDADHRAQYYAPYEAENMRMVWLLSGYDRFNNLCRIYHVEYLAGDNCMRSYRATACFVGDHWVYPRTPPGVPIIVNEVRRQPMPDVHIPLGEAVCRPAPRPMYGPYRVVEVGPIGRPGPRIFDWDDHARREYRHDLHEEREREWRDQGPRPVRTMN